MKIYYAPNTRAVRIVWLCEELGLDYELEMFKLGDASMRDPEYLKVHPMGRVPSLDDGDVSIFESGAIVEYILAKYGNGRMRPDTASPEFPNYLQWLHYAEGMIMPHVNILVVETILLPEDRRNPVNIKRSTKQLTQMLGAVDAALEGRDFLAGEFSGADIMTGHACTVAARLGADISDKPNVAAYIKRLNERPGLIKAFAT
ncbi:MAG: glutathione S-transferase family protein [Rhodospirillaceae bacterium]|nr:glutathione S-transferase family protein [Rhodospirillaceae bacterium]MBT4686661.1 glutathione S-transferase family protein [Rhodospirillaceae bacterium]MBT5082247.1 glutathione S-transferase family protein [Rhodospirillaceae bacterium]MBT5526766.1 glutathione S-transferase family protein [Rhodospirillaceae bacterium]MBT5879131.1 glutathione S-transferase family protein [Rhodospirillaceae bacterium]